MNSMQSASEALLHAEYVSVFTGAGISVESGIPPFRGEHGLWSTYNPEILDIQYFTRNPLESWKVIKEIFYDHFGKAVPNKAHLILADLEKKGIVKGIITQNIDNLHFDAGSRIVAEYHGNSRLLICTSCGKEYTADPELLADLPPRCSCGSVLKPDFVFFGEGIPEKALSLTAEIVEKTDLMLLIGTTGEIYPASLIPYEVKDRAAEIIEINPHESAYTKSITDIFIQEPAVKAMEGILDYLPEDV